MEFSIQPADIESRILLLRGLSVMLDRDLAMLYRVPTKHLNQQVKRNRGRFPNDFMFRLTAEEAEEIRSLSPRGSWHGKRPHAFTEQGAGMLAAVIRSPIAAAVTVHILRVFRDLHTPLEPAPYAPVESGRQSVFHVVRDAFLFCRNDLPLSTEGSCTYFLRAGNDGLIKIGSTRNLIVRLQTLATISPVPLRLLGIMNGDHEDFCHRRLDVYRSHGEWFLPVEPVLEFIRKHAITPPAGTSERSPDDSSPQRLSSSGVDSPRLRRARRLGKSQPTAQGEGRP
jgi:hypothetical protein